MSKGRAVSNSVLYDGITIPENPGSKTYIMQQTAGTQRDQKNIATTFNSRNIWRISTVGRPWQSAADIPTDQAEAPSSILMANPGHPRACLSRVFSLASIYLDTRSPPTKELVDLIHLIIHQIFAELLLGTGTGIDIE